MSVTADRYPGPREVVDAVFAAVRPFLEESRLALTTTGRDPVDQTITVTLQTNNTLGESVRFICEVRRSTASRLRDLRPKLDWLAEVARQTRANPMFVSMFISPGLRRELRERRVSYADATGNLWLFSEDPALMVRNNGADRYAGQTRGPVPSTLRGDGAAAVVRSLLGSKPPISIPKLIKQSRVSSSVAYRVIDVLSGEGLIEKSGRAPIEEIQRERVLRRWAEDYALDRPARVNRYFDPRGAGNALTELQRVRVPYLLSGGFAAAHYVPNVSPQLVTLFGDPESISKALRIPQEDERPNVLIFEPGLEWAATNAYEFDDLRVAAPSQAAVDLMTGPGREPEDAERLIDWMRGRDGW